jgi:hypothetical protein
VLDCGPFTTVAHEEPEMPLPSAGISVRTGQTVDCEDIDAVVPNVCYAGNAAGESSGGRRWGECSKGEGDDVSEDEECRLRESYSAFWCVEGGR